MATYTVRLYRNSGFNAVNIPDTPDLLNRVSDFTDVDSIEILQNRFLATVRVRAAWSTVRDCDYTKIGDFYYSVDGIRMLSPATAELSLTPDFITSSGGVIHPKFSILDGITERQTVSPSNDTWGKYTDDDPLTAPQQPLRLETAWRQPNKIVSMPNFNAKKDDPVFVSSTIDLVNLTAQAKGVTYTDSETGETVTVPVTTPVMDGGTSIGFEGEDRETSDGTRYYQRNSSYNVGTSTDTLDSGESVSMGIERARALGIEGAIYDQWRIPLEFIDGSDSVFFNQKIDASVEYDSKKWNLTNSYLTKLYGSKGDIDSGIPAGYIEPKNLRVLYGKYNSYGIITAAGNSCEYKPEEVIPAGSYDKTKGPQISYRADIRPNGCPYYRFKTINDNNEFWRNSLAGAGWEKVPLVYQGASGSELTRMNFTNGREIAGRQFHAGIESRRIQGDRIATNSILNGMQVVGGGALALGGMTDTGAAMMTQGLTGLTNNLFDTASLINDTKNYIDTYKLEKRNELSQLYQATEVYTPTVSFPYNPSIIRDVKGNGVLVYQYRYRSADFVRVDKLLTMYGYKEAEAFSASNFKKRKKFDYVACSTITVTGFPRWFNDGIAAQLSTGVRIWHIKPDPTAYNDNTEAY